MSIENNIGISSESDSTKSTQYATFYLGNRLYGIDVMQVQEVTQALPVTVIRLAPSFVKGLINLRGQISTAIGLRELFELNTEEVKENMTVVCRIDGNLLSLLVDRIGDVVEVNKKDYEPTPDLIPSSIKRFMKGVYKTDGPILSVIGVDNIIAELTGRNEQSHNKSHKKTQGAFQ